MNENMIRKLVKLVEDSDVDQIEISSWWKKIRITKRLVAGNNGHMQYVPAAQEHFIPQAASPVAASAPAAVTSPAPAAQTASSAVESVDAGADNNYKEITSPMVGTYYTAPAPDADPYVREGQRIEVGQVVCIVEAMKLMNEIESEVSGRIVKVLVDNAQPVEFGQAIYLIDPNG